MINACKYWTGYTGQKRPMCNGGNPCVQCRSKYLQENGWVLKNGMWMHNSREGMFTLVEAFDIQDPLT